jgi:hypothetical protein
LRGDGVAGRSVGLERATSVEALKRRDPRTPDTAPLAGSSSRATSRSFEATPSARRTRRSAAPA